MPRLSSGAKEEHRCIHCLKALRRTLDFLLDAEVDIDAKEKGAENKLALAGIGVRDLEKHGCHHKELLELLRVLTEEAREAVMRGDWEEARRSVRVAQHRAVGSVFWGTIDICEKESGRWPTCGYPPRQSCRSAAS